MSEEAFTLEYSSIAGPMLGEELHERQSTLTLTSVDQIATKEYHGSPDTSEGHPIGRFSVKLDNDYFARFLGQLTLVQPFELPPATEGVPGVSVLSVVLRQGASRKVKSFTSREADQITKMRPLLVEFSKVSGLLDRHPSEAVQIAVKHAAGEGNGRFLLTITNIGTKPVCFSNPYLLAESNPVHWAGVQIAELPIERPGVTSPPLQWHRLGLAQSEDKPTGEKVVVLQPNASFEAVTKSWFPSKQNASYLVQSAYCDYTGSKEVEKKYRIRGCGMSKTMEVKSK